MATQTREHPYVFAAASLIAGAAATAGLLWAASHQPERVVIGLGGRHDGQSERLAGCLDCHVPFFGTPGSRCLSPGCHGDLATGAPPREGPAMPIRFHVALREERCSHCHREHGIREEALFSHPLIPARVRGDCRRCHSGAALADHSRTDAVECQRCHGEDGWGAKIDHDNVTDHHCDTCHAAPADTAHQAVAGTCSTCHQTQAWKPATR